jgi:hypothetical protein
MNITFTRSADNTYTIVALRDDAEAKRRFDAAGETPAAA